MQAKWVTYDDAGKGRLSQTIVMIQDTKKKNKKRKQLVNDSVNTEIYVKCL